MSTAKIGWRLLPVLFLFYIVTLSCFGSDVVGAGFIFREGDFNSEGSTVNDSIYCSYPAEALNYLFVASTPDAQPEGRLIANVSGRCLHAAPVRLLGADNFTVLSFTTTFTFALEPRNSSTDEAIDGLAFIVVPTLAPPPDHSPAGYLGLLNSTTNNQESSHVFAVEFDSFPNSEFQDLPVDHVGIDVNSLTSTNSSAAGYYYAGCPGENPFKPIILKNGSTIQAWITYNASTQHISVTVSSLPGFQPKTPLLETKIDLSGIIQEQMYVGFSSSTGAVGGYSYVYAWSFDIDGIADPIVSETLPPPEKCPKRKSKLALILGISIPLIAVTIFAIAVLGCCYLRRMKQPLGKQFDYVIELENQDCRPKKYSYKELSAATEGFSSNHVLGRGGFGSVYKGILPRGGGRSGSMVVAVKRIDAPEATQGMQESVAEVEIISRLRHRNLVQLLGWCREKEELLLVYEYMSNGSLDQWLFRDTSGGGSSYGGGVGILSWSRRMHILRGVATALGCLHEGWKQVVLHRDVKASNVLLDTEFNAKLGDFGLARLHDHKEQLFGSTRVAGTLGYLAPEARRRGIFTDKSDVYSFGALSLEVASGRRPVDIKRPSPEISLVTWVWDLYEQGKILDAVDESLFAGRITSVDEKSRVEMASVLQIGLVCCHPDPEVRPTMRQVLEMLKGEAPLIPLASLPNRSRSRGASFSFTFSDHYVWADHSVELGMIENSEEIKLIPQRSRHSTSESFSKEPSFSFVF